MPFYSMIWMMTLTALVALFPREAMAFSLWLYLQVALAYVNARLFFMEWIIYRKLRRDFLQFGIEIPPFNFTRYQDRDRA